MNAVDTGRLRHRITIEEPTDSSDGQGGKTRVWKTFLTGFAEIKPSTGMIRLSAQKIETDVSHTVTIRFRKDLAPGTNMRVNYTVGSLTRYFYIHAMLNVEERNRYWQLLCKEGTAR
jgi:SPP1 family predicted phage head-tail adaptor